VTSLAGIELGMELSESGVTKRVEIGDGAAIVAKTAQLAGIVGKVGAVTTLVDEMSVGKSWIEMITAVVDGIL